MAEQRISDERLRELAASKRPRATSALLARDLLVARELLRELQGPPEDCAYCIDCGRMVCKPDCRLAALIGRE